MACYDVSAGQSLCAQFLPSLYPVVGSRSSLLADYSADKQSRRFSWQEAELDLMQVVNQALVPLFARPCKASSSLEKSESSLLLATECGHSICERGLNLLSLPQ